MMPWQRPCAACPTPAKAGTIMMPAQKEGQTPSMKPEDSTQKSVKTSWPCESLRVGERISLPAELPRRWYARLWRYAKWRLFGFRSAPKIWTITAIAESGTEMWITPKDGDA